MKVALYYPWVYLTSGAERTILELTSRSRHDWTIFTNRFDPQNTFDGFRNRDVVQLGRVTVNRTPVAAATAALSLATQRLPLEGYDSLVVVCEGFGDLVLLRNRRLPALCICLTPLRAVYDPIYRNRCLEGKSAWGRLAIRSGSVVFRWIDSFIWRHYRRIIAISSEAKKRAVAGGLAAGERIEVLHPGLGFEPPRPSSVFERFFLLPGRIMWTKNIELGIDAFLEFRRNYPLFADYKLIIAGIVDRKSEPYLRKLKSMAGETDGIEFRVHPSDSEMAALFQTCYATLFTAFNEDWGLVPLESMAFGKPVIAVNRGGPTESVQDGVNGMLVEPQPDLFASAMSRLAGSPELCRRLGETGHEHAKKYSWNAFANHIDSIVESVVPRPRSEPLPRAIGQGAGVRS